MTQHVLAEHTEEDTQTMRSLRRFVGMFVVFSLLLGMGVAIFAP